MKTNFHFHHTVFSSQLKSKVGTILAKVVTLRINLNIDGTPIASRSHTHPSHTQNSRLSEMEKVEFESRPQKNVELVSVCSS